MPEKTRKSEGVRTLREGDAPLHKSLSGIQKAGLFHGPDPSKVAPTAKATSKRTKERVMNSSSNGYNLRAALSAVVAAAIVGTSGLALDRGHYTALPKGSIEVGPLTPVEFLPQVAALPEVIVSAPRLAMAVRPERA
jgi:hypothetical protein